MLEAHNASEPRVLGYGDWHLPFVSPTNWAASQTIDAQIKMSVARCARVSYLNHDGTSPDFVADLALHDRLLASHHVSPFEHQARPTDHRVADAGLSSIQRLSGERDVRSGNFVGWIQYRKTLPGENVERFPGLIDKSHLAKASR